jgi:hypothetical protein
MNDTHPCEKNVFSSPFKKALLYFRFIIAPFFLAYSIKKSEKMAMAAESNKARKRRLDQGFHLRFAPPEDEKIWNPMISVGEDEFWDSCSSKSKDKADSALMHIKQFLVTNKSQLLQASCDETDRAMVVDGLKQKLIKDCDSKYPSMGYERWLMSAQEALRTTACNGDEDAKSKNKKNDKDADDEDEVSGGGGGGGNSAVCSRLNHCCHKEERDPLIPCFTEGLKPFVDSSLVQDIIGAGTNEKKALGIATRLSKSSTTACKHMKQLLYENDKYYNAKKERDASSSSSSAWILSKVDAKHEVTLTLKHDRIQSNHSNAGLFNVCLASETLNKLQILFNRTMERQGVAMKEVNKKELKDIFNACVYKMV